MGEIWATKHRPDMCDIVGQDNVKELASSLANHMIFYSPQAGTGKTSLAYALAKLHGLTLHVFNASSKKTRGIEFVEEELLPMSRTGNYNQIFLLDEADQLTPAAQSALKGVIENSQGYFILTCNDLSKITVWLQSRCQVLEFKPISHDNIVSRLKVIADKEGLHVPLEHLKLISSAHEGDLRNSINALQFYSMHPKTLLDRLVDDTLNVQLFLKLSFKEKDFENSHKMLVGRNVKNSVRSIFNYAMKSTAASTSKLKIIDACVTTERDLIMGVNEDITLANFVKLCQ